MPSANFNNGLFTSSSMSHIYNERGKPSNRSTRSTLRLKRNKSHLIFNKTCYNNDIPPIYTNIKVHTLPGQYNINLLRKILPFVSIIRAHKDQKPFIFS